MIRRSVRAGLAVMLASGVLAIGVPDAATGAQAVAGSGAAFPSVEVRVPEARTVVPTGNFRPSRQVPVRPRPTETAQQLAASEAAPPQKRPGGRAQDPGSRLAPPAAQLSFEGLDAGGCCGRPPDTHGAVGLNHFVEITNVAGIGVFRKSDGVRVKNVTLNSFFGYTNQTIFDPRVVYDRVWHRWVIVAVAFEESSTIQYVFLAVSRSSDPTGAFHLYRFDAPEPAGDFFDFPQLGMDQDALIVTANIFTGSTYVRSRAFGVPKAAAYNGRGFSFPYFNLGTPGTVAPPIVEDNNADAFLAVASVAAPTQLTLFRATGLGRGGATIVHHANVTVPSFSVPPDARQPGTTDRLDTLNGRFQNASSQIGNQLVNVHTINTGGFPTPKWYQIDTTAKTVPAGRSGFLLESTGSDDFNPAVTGSAVGGTVANPIGRMFFTWSATDVTGTDTHQARVKGSGRLATDAVDIVGGSTFAEATTFYNPSGDTVERWGDYSAVTIDPVGVAGCAAGQRAWIVNERHINSTVWGSRFGRLGFC